MKYRWRLTSRAYGDIENVLMYIQQENPAAAARVMNRIEVTLDLLAEMPRLGRPNARPNTRELAIPKTPLVIVYRIIDETIEVLTLFHTARNQRKK